MVDVDRNSIDNDREDRKETEAEIMEQKVSEVSCRGTCSFKGLQLWAQLRCFDRTMMLDGLKRFRAQGAVRRRNLDLIRISGRPK